MLTDKSETCFAKNGTPLTEYIAVAHALEAAKELKRRQGSDWQYYKCTVCYKWHLMPALLPPISNACGCADAKGNKKTLYTNEADAHAARNSAQRRTSNSLDVYKCPRKKGFHLTHRLNGREKRGMKQSW